MGRWDFRRFPIIFWNDWVPPQKWGTPKKCNCQKIGVPLVFIHFRWGCSLINYPAIGIPPCMEPPICWYHCHQFGFKLHIGVLNQAENACGLIGFGIFPGSHISFSGNSFGEQGAIGFVLASPPKLLQGCLKGKLSITKSKKPANCAAAQLSPHWAINFHIRSTSSACSNAGRCEGAIEHLPETRIFPGDSHILHLESPLFGTMQFFQVRMMDRIRPELSWIHQHLSFLNSKLHRDATVDASPRMAEIHRRSCQGTPNRRDTRHHNGHTSALGVGVQCPQRISGWYGAFQLVMGVPLYRWMVYMWIHTKNRWFGVSLWLRKPPYHSFCFYKSLSFSSLPLLRASVEHLCCLNPCPLFGQNHILFRRIFSKQCFIS